MTPVSVPSTTIPFAEMRKPAAMRASAIISGGRLPHSVTRSRTACCSCAGQSSGCAMRQRSCGSTASAASSAASIHSVRVAASRHRRCSESGSAGQAQRQQGGGTPLLGRRRRVASLARAAASRSSARSPFLRKGLAHARSRLAMRLRQQRARALVRVAGNGRAACAAIVFDQVEQCLRAR